jgi:protein gp37
MKAFFDAPGQMFFFEDNPHVWLGVTTENQRTADERIPILLQIPAAIRFVSVEPMLSEIDLSEWLECSGMPDFCDGKKLDWVIVGGETGPGARRPMPDWVRSLKNQCIAVNVPFFFKGWGAYWPQQEFYKIGKKHFGRLLDGVEWNQFPNADPLSAGVAPWFHRAPENALKGL